MDRPLQKVMHTPRRRRLTLVAKDYITPHMLRVVLQGADLADFVTLSPDDHVKVFVPRTGGGEDKRSYTVRAFDAAAQTVTLDLAVHEEGAVFPWMAAAPVGETVEIGGPRGSVLIPDTYDWYLLIADETALSAMGRRLEEAPKGQQILALACVAEKADEQVLSSAADVALTWVHRGAAALNDPAPLLTALEKLSLPVGDGFVWIGAEAMVTKALRAHLLSTRNHPLTALKARGYWVWGQADSAENFDG